MGGLREPMHNVGPQRQKVCDYAQLQRVCKIWNLCMWQADTERTTRTLINLLRMQCMQQN